MNANQIKDLLVPDQNNFLLNQYKKVTDFAKLKVVYDKDTGIAKIYYNDEYIDIAYYQGTPGTHPEFLALLKAEVGTKNEKSYEYYKKLKDKLQ